MALATMALIGGGILSGLGSIFGGRSASRGQTRAARITAAAMDRQTDLTEQMYDTTRQDLAPYREAGEYGLAGLTSAMFNQDGSYRDFEFDLTKDPLYESRLAEQTKAIERSGAARGGLLGGGTLRSLRDATYKELTGAYGRQYGEREDKFNRLSNLATMGSGAAGMQVQANQNTLSSLNNITQANANAQSTIAQNQGSIGAAQISGFTNAVGGGLRDYSMYQAYTRGGLDIEGKY